VKETVEVEYPTFRVATVFDISQTEGKELPSLAVNELVGDVQGYERMFEILKEICPVPIGFEEIPSGAKGYFHTVENRIALQEGMSEIQTVKTLVHEMTHQKLHSHEKEKPREERLSARSKEVEAESVAYTVCQHFGIDTSEYSFGYIAGWSSDRETEELKESLGKIRNTASEMITEIEEKFMEMSRAEDLEKIPETLEGLSQKSPSPVKGDRASVLETLAETRKLAEKAKMEAGEKSPRRKEEEVL
jgi:antirestriction protein ArdC